MSLEADVTVLMPNYNHAHFLPESLGAIFSQSHIPKEVLIIDDASRDESISVIQQLQKLYPQIRLIQNTLNRGPVISLNIGLQQAQGKYLAFCAADDLVLQGFFEEGAKWLDRYPNAGICCSNPSFFKNEKPYRFKKMVLSRQSNVKEIEPNRIESQFLFSPLWIPSHASLFRKEFVMQCGGFPENLHHISDWYLNIKIAINHGIIHVPTSFGAFRTSSLSYGAIFNRSYRKKASIYRELFKLLSLDPKEVRRMFRRSGALGQISGDVLLYLLLHFRLWPYIPFAFYRKVCNLLRKIKRDLTS